MDEEVNQKMSKALGVWAKRNNITPIKFRAAMEWSYNYSWRVLRGHDPFTEAAWGTFIRVYGLKALSELFRIADVDPK